MAIEQDGRHYCKVVLHENGRQVSRRIHAIVAQAVDGATYRIQGSELPDSLDLFTGRLVEGKHFMDVVLGSKAPKFSILGLFQKPKMRDVFYLWIGAASVCALAVLMLEVVLVYR